MSTILITGGTGFIGSRISEQLLKDGHEVIIMGRQPVHMIRNDSSEKMTFAFWDPSSGKIDKDAIRRADYIINLAGAGISDKKWTPEQKSIILKSRIESGQLLIKALKENPHHVKALVNASAIGWYGKDRQNLKPFREKDVSDRSSYLGQVCKYWERSILPIEENLNIRLVIIRTGIVLDPDNGFLSRFIPIIKMGIIPVLGKGRQIISWIHIDDLVNIYRFVLKNEQINGPVNAVAPEPVSQERLIRSYFRVQKKNAWLRLIVPGFLLKLAFGEISGEFLKSINVSSHRIQKEGFQFKFPNIESSMENFFPRSGNLVSNISI